MIMMAVIGPVNDIAIAQAHAANPTRDVHLSQYREQIDAQLVCLGYKLAAERLRYRLLQEIVAVISQNAERVSRD